MNYLIFSLILMPFLAAPCSYLLGQKTKPSRDLFFRFIVISEFLLALLLFIQTEGTQQRIFSLPGVCGMGMYVTSDGFRSIYTVIASLMWMVTGLFSREYFAHYRNRNRYYLFQLITLGATVGCLAHLLFRNWEMLVTPGWHLLSKRIRWLIIRLRNLNK